MKIGLLVYEPLKDQSGGYLYDRKVIDYLRTQGHETLVYTFPFEAGKVIEDRVDLLLEDELCYKDLLAFNLHLKKKTPIPVIAIVHHLKCLESIPHPEDEREKEKNFLQSCNAAIVNSTATFEEIRKLGINLPALIAKPGCDHFRLPSGFERKIPQNHFKLLSIGNLIHRKGFHLILEALEGLPEFSWELYIAGDETWDANYAGLLKRKAGRFKNKVKFLGKISGEYLSQFYLHSDIFVLPSYFEGFGMVIAEAIFHRLPVIASRVGGIPEIVQDRNEGILIPPGDKFALEQALRFFLECPERLKPFIEACSLRCSSLPTWEETGRNIANFLGLQYDEQA